ncbi:hypothetical protein EAE96_009732 [Botrytis aclada]|nr:hypothetical protein EAE96_009732 [Botrytis aclada]
MSGSRSLLSLTLTVSLSKNHYLFFPAETDDKGKVIRRLIVFRESEVDYVNADQIKPGKDEQFKCCIKVGTKSKDLIEEAKSQDKYLSEKHHPKNKLNRVMDVWASKGWVFDIEGRPLPSSLPAPSEKSGAAPKISKEKKLFGNTLDLSGKQRATGEATDSTSVSKPKNLNSKRRDKKVGPFLVPDSEADDTDSSIGLKPKPVRPKSTPDGEKKVQGKQPIINEVDKARDSISVSNPLPTSSKSTDAKTPGRGLYDVSDSESDQNTLFVSQKKHKHPKSADKEPKKPTRNKLASELFPSDEEKNPIPKSKITVGKTREHTEPAKTTAIPNTDLATDRYNGRQGLERSKPARVGATAESSRGPPRTRDDRSRSPVGSSKNPEGRQRGDTHTTSRPKKGVAAKKESTSTGKIPSSRRRTGNELASTAGIYYQSKGDYTSGRKTWVDEEIDPDRPLDFKEKHDKKLEDAENQWKRNHGTPF